MDLKQSEPQDFIMDPRLSPQLEPASAHHLSKIEKGLGPFNTHSGGQDLDLTPKQEPIPEPKLGPVQEPLPYTIYSVKEKTAIVLIASVAAFFSSVSSPIYLPAIPDLAAHFDVSTELMNLTVTMYSIFQGIGPVVWCPLADTFGRRPIVVGCFVVYIGANIGLALSQSYWVLFGLRCMQAFGIASTIALGSGVISDVTLRKERGRYIGLFTGISLMGNAFGPLIGGGLTSGLGWRSIFYFVIIASGVVLVLIAVLLPETNRFIASNGSVYPRAPLVWSPYVYFRKKFRGVPDKNASDVELGHHKLDMLYSVRLLRHLDVALLLFPGAVHYTAWFMVITAQSSLLASTYHFDSAQIGLSYLGSGIGALIGSLVGGKILNWYYRKCMGDEAKSEYAQSMPDGVDVFKARLDVAFVPAGMLAGSCIVFGWTIQYKVQYVVPLIATSFSSFSAVILQNFITTLLIDLFPRDGASCTASFNLVRCLLCGVGLAVVDKMVNRLGAGGAFTLVAGFCVLTSSTFALVKKIGPRLDVSRKQTLEH